MYAGTMQGTAVAVQPESDCGSVVQQEAERLNKQADSLLDTVARLRERLGPVLSPNPAGVPGNTGTPEPALSPLGSHLRMVTARLADAEQNLRALLQGLEI